MTMRRPPPLPPPPQPPPLEGLGLRHQNRWASAVGAFSPLGPAAVLAIQEPH